MVCAIIVIPEIYPAELPKDIQLILCAVCVCGWVLC